MQERLLKELPILNHKANILKVKLYYSKGGMNYFTGSNERRGLYLSVSPVTRSQHDWGGRSESYTAFSGVKKCVKEMARFNQKQLDTFVVDEADMKQLIDYVVRTNNLELAAEEKV